MADSRILSEDVIGNYGSDGKLAGLEILDASLLLGEELKRLVLEISPALASALSSSGGTGEESPS